MVVPYLLLRLPQLNPHLLVRPPKDSDEGRLKHFEEVYFVSLSNQGDQAIDLNVEQL